MTAKRMQQKNKTLKHFQLKPRLADLRMSFVAGLDWRLLEDVTDQKGYTCASKSLTTTNH